MPRTAVEPLVRCAWPKASNALYVEYHDTEWGVPERDSRALYEKLVLDGAQAGLSWETILNKRETYRLAFRGFDPETIARWGARERTRLMADAGIVRNRQKIDSAIANARAVLALREQGVELSDHLWGFVDGVPIQNQWTGLRQIPARTELSDRISKDLKQRGFNFVGSTIVYAFMQAVGMVNDHVVDCFRHAACARLARKGRRRA